MRVLLLDIETSPNLGWTWGKWEQNVIEFVKEWEILSFAAKWLGGMTVIVERRHGRSDKSLCKSLHKLLEEADCVVAHNGDRFDVRKINARFLKHRLTPPSPYKTVDTKKVAKRYFALNSNSLDDIGQYLAVGEKLKHGGFSLWTRCMAGDEDAWKTMCEYNKQDVILLEKVYLALRPWIKNHPNYNDFSEVSRCPKCNSTASLSRGLVWIGKTQRQKRRCNNCGGYFYKTTKGEKPTLNA